MSLFIVRYVGLFFIVLLLFVYWFFMWYFIIFFLLYLEVEEEYVVIEGLIYLDMLYNFWYFVGLM